MKRFYFDIYELQQELSDSRFYSHSFEMQQQIKVNALKELCGRLPREDENSSLRRRRAFPPSPSSFTCFAMQDISTTCS